MIRQFAFACLCAGQLLLSGCSQLYSISEQQLTEQLNDKAPTLETQNGLFKTSLTLRDMQVKLGQTPDRIDVSATSHIKIDNALFPIQAQLSLELAAVPYYNPADHSIYLEKAQILSAMAKPAELDKLIQPLLPSLTPLLNQYFLNNPIYTLDLDDPKQMMLAEITSGIKVTPGKIELVFDQ